MSTTPSQKTIVITGCSTGFGRATALHMATLGWHVFATVSKEADQVSLREEAARLNCQGPLVVMLCDITSSEQVARLSRAIGEATPRLDALVNNAGTAFAAPLELLDLDDLRQQFEINVVAQVGMIQAFLPLLKAAEGPIINISRVRGRFAAPVIGPYAASKYALEALSDSLRVELAPFGVQVVVIEPGSATTQIWAISRQRAEKLDKHRDGPYGPLLARVEHLIDSSEKHGFSAQLVAETIETILSSSRPKTRYPVPANEGRIIIARKFIPDRMWDKQVRKLMRW